MANILYDALFAPLASRDDAFLILPDGREIAGRDFLAMIHRAAHALTACGVAPGDRVAVQIAKTPEALAVYGAAVACGAIFLPLNTAYTADEVDYFVGNATPRLLLCDAKAAPALSAVATRHGARVETLNADGGGSFTDLAAGQSDAFTPVPRDAQDLAAFLYTSGTTGRSKGAMLTQDNLLSNAEVLTDYWRFTSDDVLLHALPIFHTH
ncbi:MAG: AMP-binding protein, partial [Proteobacteria bacterium]|nr:AMP-binding protein [Pseudomonadota bacterium]